MDLHEEGIHGMLDIPKTRLSENQILLRNCHESGQPWISPSLTIALDIFEYPIHFLDFESAAAAVPKLVGSHPHEAMPFQWSCHTLHKDGRMTHAEYLADDNAYPRETLFKALLEVLGNKGSICVYSPFEKRMLNEAIRAMPHREWDLQALIKRLVDLHPIVKRHLYLPSFYGSYSIKQVLPALVPELSYETLQVQDGNAAGRAFLELLETEDPALRQAKRADLLAYCSQDTLGMVKIREALLRLAADFQ
jgi:hypothetical protein